MINKFSLLKKKTIRPYIVFPAIAIALIATGWLTYFLLTHADQPGKNNQAAPAQAANPSQAIESLKKEAFKKLQAGDKDGGIAALRQALATAEKDHLTSDITYLQQQIDYAENSQLTNAESAAPAPAPTSSTSPGYSRK
jgi:hypothetical protein